MNDTKERCYRVLSTLHLAADAFVRGGCDKPIAVGFAPDGMPFIFSSLTDPIAIAEALRETANRVEKAAARQAMREKPDVVS